MLMEVMCGSCKEKLHEINELKDERESASINSFSKLERKY